MTNLQDVIHTLQYCLETLQAACECGRCDPCTLGQRDIRRAIKKLEDLDREVITAAMPRTGCDENS